MLSLWCLYCDLAGLVNRRVRSECAGHIRFAYWGSTCATAAGSTGGRLVLGTARHGSLVRAMRLHYPKSEGKGCEVAHSVKQVEYKEDQKSWSQWPGFWLLNEMLFLHSEIFGYSLICCLYVVWPKSKILRKRNVLLLGKQKCAFGIFFFKEAGEKKAFPSDCDFSGVESTESNSVSKSNAHVLLVQSMENTSSTVCNLIFYCLDLCAIKYAGCLMWFI